MNDALFIKELAANPTIGEISLRSGTDRNWLAWMVLFNMRSMGYDVYCLFEAENE